MNVENRTIFEGDNLHILRGLDSETIDLIYLDPPFNSNRTYEAPIGSEAAGAAFKDAWTLSDLDDAWHGELAEHEPALYSAISAAEFSHSKGMKAYLIMMGIRMLEMYRILKPTGSIYLHCDPTASHYLKLVMDAVFGVKNFRNEIVWHYRRWTAGNKNFQRMHDVLLRYTKSDNFKFNVQYEPYGDWIKKDYTYTDKDGRRWRWHTVKGERYKVYLEDENRGVKLNDVWQIPHLGSTANERLGYPTQKPLALYERIIKASSNPGDIVLDPFSGCGTTIEAARKNNRQAVGIDILPFALRLINRYRLQPNGIDPLPVQGVPVDFETAQQLAQSDPYQFQDWAISLVDGLASNPQKSGDEGIDGFGMFEHQPTNIDRKAIVVQVTGARGSQLAKYERLQTTIRNTNAAMGILITLDAQTAQSHWRHDLDPVLMGETQYAPIQCFSIEEYYQNGERYEPPLRLPPLANPWTGKPMQKLLFDEGIR